MKVSLVVASGVHQGKVVPITAPQFLIGRDPQCQLRPASQAVSKQHCAVIVRDGQVYVRDFGSTNGTLVNDALVQNEERLVSNNDSLKIGPLDFTIRIEIAVPSVDATPLPDTKAAEALAAVKAVSAATTNTKGSARDATPSPDSKERPALKPDSKERPALKAGAKPAEAPPPSSTADTAESADDHDKIAAMLLGLTDDGEVPQGSTVMDMPAGVVGGTGEQQAKPEEKKEAKKDLSREDMSNAANELLRKMMRRPK
jgi:predicted component of type VI protein secretion system